MLRKQTPRELETKFWKLWFENVEGDDPTQEEEEMRKIAEVAFLDLRNSASRLEQIMSYAAGSLPEEEVAEHLRAFHGRAVDLAGKKD